MSTRRPGLPTVAQIQTHCQRVRSAGSPGAKARRALVTDYQRLAGALGVVPEPVETGLDLQRASAVLLRVAANAGRSPGGPPQRPKGAAQPLRTADGKM